MLQTALTALPWQERSRRRQQYRGGAGVVPGRVGMDQGKGLAALLVLSFGELDDPVSCSGQLWIGWWERSHPGRLAPPFRPIKG